MTQQNVSVSKAKPGLETEDRQTDGRSIPWPTNDARQQHQQRQTHRDEMSTRQLSITANLFTVLASSLLKLTKTRKRKGLHGRIKQRRGSGTAAGVHTEYRTSTRRYGLLERGAAVA